MFWKIKRAKTGTRLTLHIGIHRTGTTGLQRGLAANRDRLSKLGKCYPFKGTNHQDIAWDLHRGKMTGKELVKKLEPYADAGHIILSGEDFCIHQNLDWLTPLKEIYDVDAIVYLRRQDHWLMSWYNQHIKWPFSRKHSVMTPKEFLGCLDEFHWLDFERMLGLWEKALGREKVMVLIIEKGQVEDAIGDFLTHVGIDPKALKFDASAQNDSLPTETLEYVRRAGMYDIPNPERVAIIGFLQEVAKSADCKARTLYTATERQGVLDRFDASNRATARHWFGRDALFLEDPPDDKDLYVEGSLAARGSFDDLMRIAINALSGEHK
ncbi:hypothetical protein IHQ71_06520 [Rhizobium sp. TH2]|uniref:hypothetical protein n=1 Tax=Rhizobium sp. TH2 TaxID=2775403 RepID=UPI00215860B1|nr:hypothetical protein [Rhizobium sp. TH2]UVC10254.1 hypothetical protein IHQ71_06520 [Rhizobium sp. TH2]